MKNKRTVLFPGDEILQHVASETSDNILYDLLPGHKYRIGSPANLNYQFINPVIFPDKQHTGELEDFILIQGTIVIVTSIIQMSNGDRIAVLRHYKDELFLSKFDKIFALIDLAISNHEIISLNL
jgi:hypothetical protein